MSKSKFFMALFILALSFLVVFGYGCGGGGGGSNRSDSPEVEEIQYSASDDVNFALSHIIIGYHDGDYSDYVTHDVTLPSEVEDMPVTWSSNNPSVISDSGIVSRPASNTPVTLKASAESGDYSGSVDFVLNVIKARTRTIDEAKSHEPVAPADIEDMNESNDNFMMTYDDSGELVRHIDGKFTDVIVNNADDALDAVQSVHEILGIDDPYEELEVLNIFSDEYGAQYSFRQMHDYDDEQIEVYGRTVMVSANASGDTDFLSSTVIETSRMNDVFTRHTREEAENAALNHYGDYSRLEAASQDTKLIVYSLNEYEDEPVLAFLVKVSGLTNTNESEDVYVNDDVIVSGYDLSVIRTHSNVLTWTETQRGNDEMGNTLTFPVTRKWKWSFTSGLKAETYMRDSGTPEVVVYSGDTGNSNLVEKSGSTWNDGHQVSGYTNMRTVMKWWQDTFGRKSLDNKNMTVQLVTHERVENLRDNAFWNSSTETIYVSDSSYNSTYEYSGAMGLDTLTHESTHAVLYYITGGIPYQNATGAIDEGYADIFGALRDEDWKHGWRVDDSDNNYETGITYFRDKTECRRDLRSDVSVSSLSDGKIKDVPALYERYKNVPQAGYNDHNGVHTYSRLIAHAAYLMHRDSAGTNGLSWNLMRRIWYKSLFMGLDATSDFHTIRRNVLRAALQYTCTSNQIQVIKNAFDGVGITMPKGTLKLDISDKRTGRSIRGASITLTSISGIEQARGTTNSNGDAELSADAGTYIVNISASGYLPLRFRQYLPGDNTVSLNLDLVSSGTGTLEVTVCDSQGRNINGASVYLISGWNSTGSYTKGGTSNSSGKCTLSNVSAGYYTLTVFKTSENYMSHRINIAVAPDSTNYRYVTLFTEATKYCAVIDYVDSSKSYLDVHLKGKGSIYGGTDFHVWDDYKQAYTTNGRSAATVALNPDNHIKRIYFTSFYGSPLVFFVKWDSSTDPDWRGSGVTAGLYYNNKFIRKYTPPKGSSLGLYWKVFTMNYIGVRKDTNEIVLDEPEAE